LVKVSTVFGEDRRRDLVFVLATAAVSVALFLAPTGFQSPFAPGASERVKARVTAVDDANIQSIGPVRYGEQQLVIQVLSGRFKGRTLDTHNIMAGKLELDKYFSVGDTAFVVLDLSPDRTDIVWANVIDHYRLDATLFLFALFALCLVAFAGWTGLKSLLSFVFAGTALIKFLLPAILHGWDPVWTAFAVVVALTAVTIFLVGGFTRKGMAAFVGAIGGVAITAVLAFAFTRMFKIHGAVRPFTETLLYAGFGDLDLSGLFMAGIFLASSGAVLDLAMDIAAAMSEVVEQNPGIEKDALIRSGMIVGRAVVGTQTTTLLLAYTGGFTALLMTFIAQGVPLENVLNMVFVSAELVHTLVGSFGLVLVAPVTAIAGGLILPRLSSAPQKG